MDKYNTVEQANGKERGTSTLILLRGLKSYHERISFPIKPNMETVCKERFCPAVFLLDQYKEALEEAIACVKSVHGL